MKLFLLVLAALLAAGRAAADDGCDRAAYGLAATEEARIQVRVLDALLGAGKAFAFLELRAELKSSAEEEGKNGAGETRVKLPDADAGKKTQEQVARNTRGSSEKKISFALAPRAMKLRVLHDAAVPQEKLKAVRDALLALYPGALAAGDITFVAAVFAK